GPILIMGLAPILAPVLGGQVLRFTSWHGIFVVLAGISLLLLVGAAAGLPETLPVARRREGSLADTGRTFRRLAKDSLFVGYALSGGLGFGAVVVYIGGSAFVLHGFDHLSPQTFSLVFGANVLGFVI